MHDHTITIFAVGCVESTLTDIGQAPRQGDEGAPDATYESHPPCVTQRATWRQAWTCSSSPGCIKQIGTPS